MSQGVPPGAPRGAHLLVPFAACAGAGCGEQLQALELPALAALLAQLDPSETDAGTAHDLSMPHERVLARRAGLWERDGRVPNAAWEMALAEQDPGTAAWAWITPCHWAVGRDHIRMLPPHALDLPEDEARALLAAMAPYFAEDGITLAFRSPLRWLAHGEPLRELPCASLDRVSGAVVDDWLPRGDEARTLRRLQQEMQMLLYTHPVNEGREARGMPPVNSFWVSGAGALPPGAAPALPAGLQVFEGLREPALAGDWPAWAAAWHGLDAGVLAGLRAALDRGEPVSLTLCGAASARTWAAVERGAWRRALRVFRSAPPVAQVLATL
ncbi:phosphoglycerate mutase [Ramlibacter sp. AN1015]|uniref:phosphoglycerate mutase n=1 Tax=Ramlibacter sp. AN1015 TaxID=3133428 RepID=UPI0030C5BF62